MIDAGTVIHRVDELRAEITRGERALAALDSQRAELVAGLMRLGGAVTALEELLAAEHTAIGEADHPVVDARRVTVPG